LNKDALKGARIGVLKVMFVRKPEHDEVNRVMADAISAMARREQRSSTSTSPPSTPIAERDVQKYEYKTLINQYLASIPSKTIADILAQENTTGPRWRSSYSGTGNREWRVRTRIQRAARAWRADPAASTLGS
jgi:hypothetical protein